MEFNVPSELKYTKSHEWVRVENNLAVMGVTDYAQHQLSDVVYVELPRIGDIFEKGRMIGEIESVKAVNEFYMPLSGEIVEINGQIRDKPELINSSPYEEGWFLKIKFNKPTELDTLLTAIQYKELIQEEENQ
ncbi:MAG: glycine cleavage system protein GcvH [Promethearchaeota archaeon]